MLYLNKILLFLVVSWLLIIQYYKVPFHVESSDWYSVYIISILIIYGIYKFTTLYFWNQKLSFSPLSIFWYSLLNLFILSFIYFNLIWGTSWSLVLFFKIITFLILPFLITIISYSFAKKILNYINWFNNEEMAFRFLMSLWLWFFLFLTPLIILWSFGLYNIWTVITILIVFILISYKELYESFVSLYTFKIEVPNHKPNWNIFEQINLYLLSSEFLFIFINFLIWVNFINIVRPMPIWWDDLWVYMNFPQIMANSWEILKWVWMISWQVLTWIWYMFHSAPQAFFLNQLWWILSIITLIIVFSSLLKTDKKNFLNLPLLWAAVFYSMPMVIFQQAKDMKLDPWLFFISIIGLYLTYYLSLKYLWFEENEKIENWKLKIENNKFLNFFLKITSVFKSNNWISNFFDKKEKLVYMLIIWIIIWLAFSIKFTTLMLILGIIWVIFYINIGFSWFLWYFFAFIAIFTKLKLWSYLNINYPKDNDFLLNNVFIFCIIISIILFSYTFYKYNLKFLKKAFILTLIFSTWIFLGTSTWLIKNVSESWNNISIVNILNWKAPIYFQDYTKIYSQDELNKIEEKFKVEATSSSWKTQNEDLGRYFWYEDGINNYLKLPLNLTFQSNQSWEYTEITYIFLALIPLILIFLNFKNVVWTFWIILWIIFEFLYFFYSPTSKLLTDFFAIQQLPGWYIFIVAFFLLILIYFIYWLKNDKISQIFKLNIVFITIYVLIFVVAAYGIVWYWIVMYFSFLLIILAWWYYITQEDTSNEKLNIFRLLWSIVLFTIVSIYFLKSSYPHWFNNLKNAWFNEFKAWIVNQEEWIFNSHPDYFTILATLNISNQDKIVNEIVSEIKNKIIKKIILDNSWDKLTLWRLESILKQFWNQDLQKLWADSTTEITIKTEVKNILNKIYKLVLYPPKEIQNNDGIYRIWTFLTYFISNNRNRYYDDSLIFQFDKYFYNKDPEITIWRMKKMWLKYLLVDLNAATIDKDPRHDLTRRFENLLQTFKSSRLELIQTDSICLQIALEEKDSNYMTYAWVNYESYTQNGETINRWKKQLDCYNHILQIMKEWKISPNSYSYLMPLANYMKENPPKDQNELINLFRNYISHGWLALFKIK